MQSRCLLFPAVNYDGGRHTVGAAAELFIRLPNAGAYGLSLHHLPWDRIASLRAAVTTAREVGDRRAEGSTLGNLGAAYATLGETRPAIGFYKQHLEIAREIGDRRGEGNTLNNLGLAYAAMGKTRRAIELLTEAADVFAATDSPLAAQVRRSIETIRGLDA